MGHNASLFATSIQPVAANPTQQIAETLDGNTVNDLQAPDTYSFKPDVPDKTMVLA